MFSIEEIRSVVRTEQFAADYRSIHESLARLRLQQQAMDTPGLPTRLRQFIEMVLASAPEWDEDDESHDVCRRAAEAAELVAARTQDRALQHRMTFRAGLLYELAALPAMASALASADGFSGILKEFLCRSGPFSTLDASAAALAEMTVTTPSMSLAEVAVAADAGDLAWFEQGEGDHRSGGASAVAGTIAAEIQLEMTTTELAAFSAVVGRRASRATRNHVSRSLFESLRGINGPTELFSAQAKALEQGLLDKTYDSWGLAAPTGSGKTFLARVLILDLLAAYPGAAVLYLVPSKALVSEVANDLGESFQRLEIKVIALSAQLNDLSEEEGADVEDAGVIVLTPEKADLLLRLGASVMSRVRLVVVDEAHHIEAGTRGVLLELYLWRMRRLLPATRFVLLSAVAPNIKQLTTWLGSHSNAYAHEARSTRMRAGVYRIKGEGKQKRGVIDYSDNTSIVFVEAVRPGMRASLLQLVQHLAVAGPILVVAKGKRESETLAEGLLEQLKVSGPLESISDSERGSDLFRRLDSRLQREMYSAVSMRSLLPYRIAYHHAGLPPRVRHAVEEAIRKRLIRYVFATTTLAEGVNFPFSSVVVQSLAIREMGEPGRSARYHAVTPRMFWNIAGRAGRPGRDREGQAILFEPSLGLDKIAAVLGPYLNPSLKESTPVRSALADGLREVADQVLKGEITLGSLNVATLPPEVSRRSRGAINLLRVGLVHARASNIIRAPEEILEGTFAAMFLEGKRQAIANDLIRQQAAVVDEYLGGVEAPSVDMVAKLGLSIETLSEIKTYVEQLTDWQIRQFSKLLFGGTANLRSAQYVVAPIAKRMAELEGQRLGGFYSEVIIQWLSGVPFSRLKAESLRLRSIEDLISVVYSRVQFLLPWGLYAADAIVTAEASKRGIEYDGEVRKLAYLVDAGVPSFDALRLTHLGIERVDAARLARSYAQGGGLRRGVDVVGWLGAEPRSRLHRIIQGDDDRPIDHDFDRLVEGAARP